MKPKVDKLLAQQNRKLEPAIVRPKRMMVVLEIGGTADIIQNCFSQKSIEEMLRKHMGFPVERQPKKPRQLIEDAKIRNVEGRVCIPAAAVKKTMVTASAETKGLKAKQIKTGVRVIGSGLPITFEAEIPRMDMVRTSGMNRTPDVRFRPSYTNWKARVAIEFPDTMSVQAVVDLLFRGGSVGVGEWRPEKNGSFGTFEVIRHISDPKEIAEVIAESMVPLVTPRIPEWAMDAEVDPEMISKAFAEGSKAELEDEELAS